MADAILQYFIDDDSYQHGKNLLSDNKYKEAYECFFKAYEQNPTDPDICYYLFACLVGSKNYEEAFSYFEVYFSNVQGREKTKANMLLFVLGNFMFLSEEYYEKFKKLEYYDFKLQENDIRDFPHRFRYSLSIYNFKEAHKLLSSTNVLDPDIKITNDLLKNMLLEAIDTENKYRNQVLLYSKSRDYDGAISTFQEKSMLHPLSYYDECILKLLYRIKEVLSGTFVEKRDFTETNAFFKAIEDDNYSLALSLSKEYTKKFEGEGTNTLELLLRDLIAYIDNNKLISELYECVSNLNTNDDSYEIKKHIYDEIIRVLSEAGITVIDCCDLEAKKIISNIVGRSKSLRNLNIGENRVVVRCSEERRDGTNNAQLISEGNTYYFKKEYDSCISVFEYFLRIVNDCDANIYFTLGKCYLKKGNKYTALMYFSIAKELYFKEECPFALENILIKLNDELYPSCDNKRPSVNNAKAYREIVRMVIYEGINIDVACANFNLDLESEMIARLHVAKEYYNIGQNSKAEYIIFNIECKSDLPTNVSEMLNKIKQK